jgi:hypothetical protein
MIQITQAPTQPVQVGQRFMISGTAAANLVGQKATVVIDDRFNAPGPVVEAASNGGVWQFQFVFQQVGDRRLQIKIGSFSAETKINVIAAQAPMAPGSGTTPAPGTGGATPPPVGAAPGVGGSPSAGAAPGAGSAPGSGGAAPAEPGIPPVNNTRLKFNALPKQVQAGKVINLSGQAKGYKDGDPLALLLDRIVIARPSVKGESWQAAYTLWSPGKRTLSIIGFDPDNDRTDLEVVAKVTRRLTLKAPAKLDAEQMLTLSGDAVNYADGDQLVVRIDGKSVMSRPLVSGQKWSTSFVIRYPGRRLIEVIGSEQDIAESIVEVVANTNTELKVTPRSAWTNNPTSDEIADMPYPKRLTVHHTALNPAPAASATVAQECERMRFLRNSHVNGNGWSDLGYHFIIMPSGRIYEGRSQRKRGSHDVVNDGLGIAFDGVYSTQAISQAQFNAAVALFAQLFKQYRFGDPTVPVPTPTEDFGTRNLSRICCHRDRVATDCPGSEGGRTVRLPEIRQAVKAKLGL